MKKLCLLACLFATPALAAHRLQSVTVSPNPAAFAGGKAPEVQVVVAVERARSGPSNCEASVDFGDGARPRAEDFGMSATRSFRKTYAKGGTYAISVRGSGKVPCEGVLQASLTVTGEPAKKKAEEKKKAEPKKKTEPKKKAEPKKKPAPKKKGAEAPSSKKDSAKP
jgi:hypothetical protein